RLSGSASSRPPAPWSASPPSSASTRICSRWAKSPPDRRPSRRATEWLTLRPPAVYGRQSGARRSRTNVEHLSLPDPRRAARVEVRGEERDQLHLGVRGWAREAAQPLREGQEAAVGRGHPDRLVAGPRSREPDDDGRSRGAHLGLADLGQAHREGAGARPPP